MYRCFVWQEDCPFYLRTKMCKYGNTCKFNHPEMADAIPAGQAAGMTSPAAAAGLPESGIGPASAPAVPDCAMNSLGYPLRPGKKTPDA